MTTLSNELYLRGISYNSLLTNRANDILFSDVLELCEVLGYIARNVSHIDGEYPQGIAVPRDWNMPITDNITSGGHEMKWGRQYRVYLGSVVNCPPIIRQRLHNDQHNRFGGSRFVEALLACGFTPGYGNNANIVMQTLVRIFTSTNEQNALTQGFNL
ncbi:MAG: hypothetical protein FWC16_01135 [Defluviitaleaceae bacterium]|nr:hypothetical protein [Defluviitaleaceae bacterium]MCL2273508.1 hypothetical protein [Defluviitaleaceae bacterium]